MRVFTSIFFILACSVTSSDCGTTLCGAAAGLDMLDMGAGLAIGAGLDMVEGLDIVLWAAAGWARPRLAAAMNARAVVPASDLRMFICVSFGCGFVISDVF